MKLLTKKLKKQIPFSQDVQSEEDAIAYVKFFNPMSNWTWYVCRAYQLIESDEEGIIEKPLTYSLNQGEKLLDILFYGLVYGIEREFGEFSLKEFEDLRASRSSHTIERDRYWDGPKPIAECKGPGT